MRIAISNIAWEVAEDAAVADLLARHHVDAIDVAPGKYFPDPASATPQDIRHVRQWWESRGITIPGMQALLFGATGLNLFGKPESRAAMLERLGAVCRVAEHLGATRLVFGSPKNRDRSGLSDAETERLALEFFGELGNVAAQHAACICLEPNPARYGCNFLANTPEAAAFVRRLGHPAIRLHLDTGTIAVNGEDADALVRDHADIIAHVHASEPDLVTLGDGSADHVRVADALRRHAPEKIVSIEMLPAKSEPHTVAIDRALALAIRAYGDDRGGGKSA